MHRIYTIDDLDFIYRNHPLHKTAILQRLRDAGADLGRITEIDLARDEARELTDQNHLGGLDAVIELAQASGVTSQNRILDIGSGLGGTARVLAHTYGCRVDGIEITELRHCDAADLTRLVGLDHLVRLVHADFLNLDVPPRSYDVVFCQATASHFNDKGRLLDRCTTTLVEGGRLAVEDCYLRGPIATNSCSQHMLDTLQDCWKAYLIPLEEWRAALERHGFVIEAEADLSQPFLAYYGKMLAVARSSPAGTFSDNEVTAWRLAVELGSTRTLGYSRQVSRLATVR